MIRIFHGSDRAKIAEEVRKILGEDYEVFDGEELKIEDIVNIFKGTTLFAEKRKILIKDLTKKEDADFYEEMSKYADTEHDIVIWETTLPQKKSYKDFVKGNKIEVKRIDVVDKIDTRAVFGIFDTAMNNGPRAVEQLEKIESKQDPYMFFGLMVSQAIKRYSWRGGRRERAILKELAKLDMQMKSAAVEPWNLIKSFLLRLGSL